MTLRWRSQTEFFCVKSWQCQFLQSLWSIWIVFCMNGYKIQNASERKRASRVSCPVRRQVLLYSGITVSVNISDKPEKWGSIFFSHGNPKENKMVQLHQLILNFNNYLFNRSGICARKQLFGPNMQAFNWLTMDVWWAVKIDNLKTHISQEECFMAKTVGQHGQISARRHLGISVKCCHCALHIHVSGTIWVSSFQKHLSIAGKIFHPETCSLADKIFETNCKSEI